jgi:hypothetical protein
MMDEITKLIDDYVKWLRDKTHYRQISDWVEITTPFLNSDNDYIQIYAQKHNGGFLLPDDGYTIDDLELHGLRLESPKRQELLNMTLNGFGVQLKNHRELMVSATPENFPIRKHNLIQAIISVNDMFHLAKPMVASLFYEDVVAWLDLNDIRYTPEIKFTGKSGFDHLFDFVIPKSRQKPERILRAINRPDRDSAQQLVFAWTDTREVRPPQSLAYAILNDSEQHVSSSILDALKNYEVRPILWSNREQAREELAA